MVVTVTRQPSVCGYQRGTLVCEWAPHPEHPRAHVYVSDDGSHVQDRHGS
jgi:hypothetical protein